MVAERIVETGIEEMQNEVEPQPIRWTTEQFQQMGGAGFFEGRRVFLMEGEIFEMTVGTAHFTGVMLVTRALEQAFGTGFYVRPQGPLNINERTDPEPDIAVVKGQLRDYGEEHPTTALLVVEVSDSTLRYDQTKKASLYARAGIADYWILNLVEKRLEVHRAPLEKSGEAFGWAYESVQMLDETAQISPLDAPEASIAVADLLP